MVRNWIQKGNWNELDTQRVDVQLDWLQAWMSGQKSLSFYSSGTTGEPKKIDFTREQIVSSAKRTAIFFNLHEHTKVLSTLPYTFVAGRMNVLRALILNHDLYILDDWHDQKDWEGLSHHEIDWWTCTPMMLESVINMGIDLSFIKKILLGGGPIPPHLQKIMREMSCEIWEGYGMTETLTHIACRRVNGPSVGQGFQFLEGVRGYLGSNENLIVEDEILGVSAVTNDRIAMQEDGSFLVLGRLDDVINSGGIKIFPDQVEKYLRPHVPGNFAIVKAKDEKLSEKVICLFDDETFDHTRVNWSVVFSLHPYWKPREFIHVKVLPYNTNGKLIREWKYEE